MPALRRLVRIGGCSNCDLLIFSNFLQIAAQQPGGLFLHEDLVLELCWIVNLHEVVRVTRVAILAREFAPTVRIDRPREGEVSARVAAVEDRAHRQREELNLVPAVDLLCLARQFSDANQARRGLGGI